MRLRRIICSAPASAWTGGSPASTCARRSSRAAVRERQIRQHPRKPVVQRNRLLGERAAALDARQLERLVDLRLESMRVLEQPPRELCALLSLGDRLGLQTDAGQRRAQLMRHGGKEALHGARALVLAPVQPRQQQRHRQQQRQETARLSHQHQTRA